MKKLICTLLAFSLVFTVASAEMSLNIEKDSATGKHTVSGNVDEAGIPVKVEVFKNCVFEAVNPADYADMDIMYSTDSKEYSFEIPLTASGNYAVRVSDFYGNEKRGNFRTYTDAAMKTAVETFLTNYQSNSAATLEGNIVKAYYMGLDINYEDILTLSTTPVDNRAAFYANAYAAVDGAVYEDFANLVKAELGIALISQTGDAKYVESYKDVLKLADEKYFNDYTLLPDADKLVAVSNAVGVSDKAGLNSALIGPVALLTLKNSATGSYYTKLSYYENDIANLNAILTAINGLSNTAQSKIYSDLKIEISGDASQGILPTLTDSTQLVARLTVLKNTYANITDPLPQGTTPSGSSSGSGPSFVAPPQVVKPVNIPFNDLDSVPWASADIIALYEKGIVNGVGGGNFNPDGTLKREEFVAMLVRALGFTGISQNSGFDDVPNDRWSSGAIIAARDNGIVNGISETRFGAEDNIKRCDMTVIAYNALSKMGVNIPGYTETSFTDNDDIPDYAKTAVSIMAQLEVVKGSENYFMPADYSTRAQAAVIINRIIKLIS